VVVQLEFDVNDDVPKMADVDVDIVDRMNHCLDGMDYSVVQDDEDDDDQMNVMVVEDHEDDDFSLDSYGCCVDHMERKIQNYFVSTHEEAVNVNVNVADQSGMDL
jgi:hypothetical protein